jgi:hypothetical protein
LGVPFPFSVFGRQIASVWVERCKGRHDSAVVRKPKCLVAHSISQDLSLPQVLILIVVSTVTIAQTVGEGFCGVEDSRQITDSSCDLLFSSHVEKRETKFLDVGFHIELVRGELDDD